ncbi:MAG: helix-turn-helix domain-containing protein [Thermoplasmatota archaeon]
MEAVLDIVHRGCYTSRLTLDFPVRIAVLSGHRTRRGSVGLWEMAGPPDAIAPAFNELRRHPNIVEARVLSDEPGRWIVETIDKEAGVSNTLVDEGLVFLPPVMIANGRERYHVFAIETAQVERAVRRIRKAGNDVAVASARTRVGGLSVFSTLTPQQQVVLQAAHRMGYYKRPRKADQERIARALRLSRPTIAEHLALAEARVMDQILGSES